MAMLGKRKKQEARHRLRELERKLDLKDVEKRLGQLDLKELEKRLEKLDLDKELAKRYRELRPARQQKRRSSAAGFLAGVAIGAIVGVVLAIIFGKRNNDRMMDQFAHRAETITEGYRQVRDDVAGQAGADPFGGAAIEREVNGDVVDTARDTVDSASEDVQDTVEDVQTTNEGLAGDPERRYGEA